MSLQPAPPARHEGLRRKLGWLLIAAGALAMTYLLWQLFGTGLYTAHAQDGLRGQLKSEWARQPEADLKPRSFAVHSLEAHWKPPAPRPGGALAILRIPRLGSSWERVIIEGVSRGDLARGPGHYPGTAMPGELGNFVVSGHRTTHGAPFWSLDRLRAGDAVLVEVAAGNYRYAVTRSEIVSPSAVAVIAPVPGRPGVRPTQAMLTFTTCNPRFSARQRLIVHAELTSFTPTTR